MVRILSTLVWYVRMSYLNVLFLFIALFLLTSLLCWISIGFVMLSPFYSIALFLAGVLGVVMALDAIKSLLFP